MCSRYSLTSPPEAVRAYFGYANEADFPPRYNPASVSTQAWGELTLRFTNKDAGRALWTTSYPGYASGEMPIQRLTQPASSYDPTSNQIASCHAGSW